MAPFGMCAELLNTKVVQPLLGPGMEIAVKYAQNRKFLGLQFLFMSHISLFTPGYDSIDGTIWNVCRVTEH